MMAFFFLNRVRMELVSLWFLGSDGLCIVPSPSPTPSVVLEVPNVFCVGGGILSSGDDGDL